MAFCQKCGSEVQGTFCPNCGTQVGDSGKPDVVVYNNVSVKPRYGTGTLVLAGYLGFSFLFPSIIFIIVAIGSLFVDGFTLGWLGMLIGVLIFALIGLLFYLPGITSIRKRTPKELVAKTTVSFMIRSILFLFAWAISIMFTMFILGIVFRVWRIGLAVSKPKDNEYTAFLNGEMIPVTRITDWEYSTVDRIRYMYVDADGTYYRPAL